MGTLTYAGPRGPVPFTATIDAQDRLSSIAISLPSTAGQPAATVTARFSDFGAPATIAAPPAGQTEEAPKDVFPPLVN